jgi:hypothetical protein
MGIVLTLVVGILIAILAYWLLSLILPPPIPLIVAVIIIIVALFSAFGQRV